MMAFGMMRMDGYDISISYRKSSEKQQTASENIDRIDTCLIILF